MHERRCAHGWAGSAESVLRGTSPSLNSATIVPSGFWTRVAPSPAAVGFDWDGLLEHLALGEQGAPGNTGAGG